MPSHRKTVKLDRATLLAAAQRIFGQAGLEGASMRAIAREAGCDVSLIYYYFENKEAIFSALLDARIPPLVREVRRLANPRDPRSTAEKLWTIIQVFHGQALLMAERTWFEVFWRGVAADPLTPLPFLPEPPR